MKKKTISIAWLEVLRQWLEQEQLTASDLYQQWFSNTSRSNSNDCDEAKAKQSVHIETHAHLEKYASHQRISHQLINHQRISYQDWITLLTACAALKTTEVALGITLAKMTTIQTFGVVGYLLKNSLLLENAIQLLDKYEYLIYGSPFVRVKTGVKYSYVSWEKSNEVGRFDLGIEFSIAALYQSLSSLNLVDDVSAVEITFPYLVDDLRKQVYQSFYPFQLHFIEGDETIIRIPNYLLKAQLPHADLFLQKLLERQAQTLLHDMQQSDDLIENIRKIVTEHLESGQISLPMIAKALGYSERSLQRHLKEQNQSWQSLLNDTRQNLAADFLQNTKLSIAQVAYKLGYSDQSAFNKAFIRWYGLAPLQWRRLYLDHLS